MSSPPDPPTSAPSPTSPVHFTPVNRNPSGGDRDAPGAGRLADISESGLTRGGRAKTKLTMKPVTRTAKKEPVDGMQATTPTPSPRGRGRGRGVGRGAGRGVTEKAPLLPVTGPFAAGPADRERRTIRPLAADGLITVESTSVEATAGSEPTTTTSTAIPVKTEDTASKQSGTRAKPATSKKTKVKKEIEDSQELPEDFMDELGLDERVDLAELNLPGGPVSSQRKTEHMGRWKKVELWIEQEEAEDIVLDDDEEDTTRQEVHVKIEDELMEDITLPDVGAIPTPQVMSIEPDEEIERKMRLAAKSRKRRKRRALKGKTQEEKEEMAREEVDLEVLRKEFQTVDGSEREQRLFLLQLPHMLPPLRDAAGIEVKTEVKVETPSGPALFPSGKVGQLRIHASGKTVLSYGGIDFPIRLASDVGFAQDFVAVDPVELKKAWRLGNVGAAQEGGWLIGVPDLKRLHR